MTIADDFRAQDRTWNGTCERQDGSRGLQYSLLQWTVIAGPTRARL
jgi:hypothetical protein